MRFHRERLGLGEYVVDEEINDEKFNEELAVLRLRREECGENHKSEMVDFVRESSTYCHCNYCCMKYTRPYKEGDLDKDSGYIKIKVLMDAVTLRDSF